MIYRRTGNVCGNENFLPFLFFTSDHENNCYPQKLLLKCSTVLGMCSLPLWKLNVSVVSMIHCSHATIIIFNPENIQPYLIISVLLKLYIIGYSRISGNISAM